MNDTPPSFLSSVISPIAELVLRIGGYATLSVVFVVEMLYLAPEREITHRNEMEAIRQNYAKIIDAMDMRDSSALAASQMHCEAMILENRTITTNNAKILLENKELLLELLNRHPEPRRPS